MIKKAAMAIYLAALTFAVGALPVKSLAKDDSPPSADSPEVQKALADRKAELLKRRADLTRKAKSNDPNAIVDLAGSLEMSDGVNPVDRTAAFDFYEKAANEGERVGRQKICLAYLLGEGRERSVVKGMSYCNALGLKDDVGLFAVAYDYQNGLSGPKDEDTAMDLYVKAFQAGSGDAAAALGTKALAMGKPEAARQWFRRGAYLGSAAAIDHLAIMTETGQGGAKDEQEARWLYLTAAEHGNADATERMKAWPDAKEPSSIRAFLTQGAAMPITHTWTDANGPHAEAIDLHLFDKLMADHVPMDRRGDVVEGDTHISCYIGADHVLDVCIVRQEFPIGYGIGALVQAFFSGHVTVAPTDAAGADTADRILNMSMEFRNR